MTDARDYSQVLECIRKNDGTVILYIKDKRDNSLWIEIHTNTQAECSVKSLLKGDAKAPCVRMPITQDEIDNKIDYDLSKIYTEFIEHYKVKILDFPNQI